MTTTVLLAIWDVLYFVVAAAVLVLIVKSFRLHWRLGELSRQALENQKLAAEDRQTTRELLATLKAWVLTHEENEQRKEERIQDTLASVPAKVVEKLETKTASESGTKLRTVQPPEGG